MNIAAPAPAPAPRLVTRVYQFNFISRTSVNGVGSDGLTPLITNVPMNEWIDDLYARGGEVLSERFSGYDQLRVREPVEPDVPA